MRSWTTTTPFDLDKLTLQCVDADINIAVGFFYPCSISFPNRSSWSLFPLSGHSNPFPSYSCGTFPLSQYCPKTHSQGTLRSDSQSLTAYITTATTLSFLYLLASLYFLRGSSFPSLHPAKTTTPQFSFSPPPILHSPSHWSCLPSWVSSEVF